MRPPLRAEFRISAPAMMAAAAIVASTMGFAGGAFVLGPKFTDETAKEAGAAQRAERFAPRSVDLTRHYPDPFVYRTRTPEFPHDAPTGIAAAARELATQSMASAPSHPPSQAFDSRDGHDAFARYDFGRDALAETAHRPARYDRHTNNMH